MNNYGEKLQNMVDGFDVSYVLMFVVLFLIFFMVLKVLWSNRARFLIGVFVVATVLVGFTISISDALGGEVYLIFELLLSLFVFIMYHTEIKRTLLDGTRNRKAVGHLTVSGIENIIDEMVRAIQNMSKNNVGALIVLSNDNLPEGIIETGTIINAEINAPMIETVFFPKTPLHDGAMVILENKIYAAGCFLPIIQNENLPQTIGSRHRAAMGVTSVANVTAIVVSEETGIISLVRGGNIYKSYATGADVKKALGDYYWSDQTAEDK